MANQTVSIQDFFFDPDNVTINRGDTIEWVNEGGNPHTVTWSSVDQVLRPGQRFSHQFDQAGTINYRCRFHASSHQMAGTVVVNA
jgi:plastocyanin